MRPLHIPPFATHPKFANAKIARAAAAPAILRARGQLVTPNRTGSDHLTDRRLTRRPPPTFADIMFRTLLLLAFAVWCAAAARIVSSSAAAAPFCAQVHGLAAPRLAAHPASRLLLAARAACGRPAPREQGAGVARCNMQMGARKGVAKKAVVKKSSSTEGKGGIFPWITNKPGSACRATTPAGRRRRRQPPAPDAAAAAAAPSARRRPAAAADARARPPPPPLAAYAKPLMLSQIDFTGADGAKMIGPSGNANIFEFSKFLYEALVGPHQALSSRAGVASLTLALAAEFIRRVNHKARALRIALRYTYRRLLARSDRQLEGFDLEGPERHRRVGRQSKWAERHACGGGAAPPSARHAAAAAARRARMAEAFWLAVSVSSTASLMTIAARVEEAALASNFMSKWRHRSMVKTCGPNVREEVVASSVRDLLSDSPSFPVLRECAPDRRGLQPVVRRLRTGSPHPT